MSSIHRTGLVVLLLLWLCPGVFVPLARAEIAEPTQQEFTLETLTVEAQKR